MGFVKIGVKYETARYDVFGYWWITGYFWNGLEYTY